MAIGVGLIGVRLLLAIVLIIISAKKRQRGARWSKILFLSIPFQGERIAGTQARNTFSAILEPIHSGCSDSHNCILINWGDVPIGLIQASQGSRATSYSMSAAVA